MTDATAQNPFAPPRAHVEDHVTAATTLVPATRLSRFLAVLIDGSPGIVIAVVALVVALVAMPGVFSGNFDPKSLDWPVVGMLILVVVAASIAWMVWMIVLLYRYGQTVGKKVMGIRVVRMDGSRVSFARFFFIRGGVLVVIRAVVGGIGGGMAAVAHVRYGNFSGYLVTLIDALMIFGAARRCLHDYIADTQVVTAASSPNATLEGTRGY